jgi:hypothetical protein
VIQIMEERNERGTVFVIRTIAANKAAPSLGTCWKQDLGCGRLRETCKSRGLRR